MSSDRVEATFHRLVGRRSLRGAPLKSATTEANQRQLGAAVPADASGVPTTIRTSAVEEGNFSLPGFRYSSFAFSRGVDA